MSNFVTDQWLADLAADLASGQERDMHLSCEMLLTDRRARVELCEQMARVLEAECRGCRFFVRPGVCALDWKCLDGTGAALAAYRAAKGE